MCKLVLTEQSEVDSDKLCKFYFKQQSSNWLHRVATHQNSNLKSHPTVKSHSLCCMCKWVLTEQSEVDSDKFCSTLTMLISRVVPSNAFQALITLNDTHQRPML